MTFSSSIFLGVNELAFMLYLLFLCCLFWALKQTYEYFPPVKFTLAL